MEISELYRYMQSIAYQVERAGKNRERGRLNVDGRILENAISPHHPEYDSPNFPYQTGGFNALGS